MRPCSLGARTRKWTYKGYLVALLRHGDGDRLIPYGWQRFISHAGFKLLRVINSHNTKWITQTCEEKNFHVNSRWNENTSGVVNERNLTQRNMKLSLSRRRAFFLSPTNCSSPARIFQSSLLPRAWDRVYKAYRARWSTLDYHLIQWIEVSNILGRFIQRKPESRTKWNRKVK